MSRSSSTITNAITVNHRTLSDVIRSEAKKLTAVTLFNNEKNNYLRVNDWSMTKFRVLDSKDSRLLIPEKYAPP